MAYRANKSESGREPAQHHVRGTNTLIRLDGLVDGVQWKTRKLSRKEHTYVSECVVSGPECRLGSSALAKVWAGGFGGGPAESSEGMTQGDHGKERGASWGSATWEVKLWSPDKTCIEGWGAAAGDDRIGDPKRLSYCGHFPYGSVPIRTRNE